MQTSIEWLAEQYKKCGVLTEERLKKAIEMHRQEQKKAYIAGSLSLVDDDSFEQYYKETFKKD